MGLVFLALLSISADTPLPRVLVMVAEQTVNQTNVKYWWSEGGFKQDWEISENFLNKQLTERGYTVVDRQVLAGKVKATTALQGADPADSAVKEFALQTGAEVVIVGKAIAVDAGPMMGTPMRSVQATLSLRVISLDDAKIITSANTTQVFGHVDAIAAANKALEKAAKKVGDEILPKLSEAWLNRVQTIACKVSGVKNLDDLKQLKTALALKLGSAASVSQRSFKTGSAELEIRYPGNGQRLAEAVEGVGFGKKRVEVDGVSQATVSLKLTAQ